ncbi:homeobox protein Hox-B7 isoform X2 [Hemicordylus capensis]|uniref:homeobox protein Hox-B7 isoform X2 n=1 Tax=Hemicordylus capensis TaxID=884348 RepID=UPI002304BB02|nr:homeobox protein Hox-B7 isoform X2 [Hemicordylus capensis]
MSSLYYANALFSKYQAANSVFPSGVFPEQTSCAFASNAQRPGYGSSSTASFAASMPGLYPNGGGMHPQAPGMYSGSYGLEASSFNMHCSPFEQNLSMMCPGDASKPNCNKSDQRDADLRHENNLRIYPWMRSTGTDRKRGRQTYTRETDQNLVPKQAYEVEKGK